MGTWSSKHCSVAPLVVRNSTGYHQGHGNGYAPGSEESNNPLTIYNSYGYRLVVMYEII